MTVTLQNPNYHATGAISTFVYVLTGSMDYTLTVPKGYQVIGILANFASATSVGADNSIITNVTNKTVKVYAGTSLETENFSITAVAFAKKAGGV